MVKVCSQSKPPLAIKAFGTKPRLELFARGFYSAHVFRNRTPSLEPRSGAIAEGANLPISSKEFSFPFNMAECSSSNMMAATITYSEDLLNEALVDGLHRPSIFKEDVHALKDTGFNALECKQNRV